LKTLEAVAAASRVVDEPRLVGLPEGHSGYFCSPSTKDYPLLGHLSQGCFAKIHWYGYNCSKQSGFRPDFLFMGVMRLQEKVLTPEEVEELLRELNERLGGGTNVSQNTSNK
jgi:hypothetical protein